MREASPSSARSPGVPLASDARDPRWDLVEKICASPQFRRSARLRELLIYLCHRAWTEGAEEIREHEVGVEVFERSPTYDPAQETIVRVQASQLRKRLEHYFAEDGAAERSVLEIPKGGYLPAVRDRPGTTTSGAPGLTAPVTTPAGSSRERRWIAILSSTCLLLAIACCVLIYRQRERPAPPPTGTPALSQFWSAFAANGRQTFVVVADSAFSALQDTLHRPIGLSEYVRRAYKADLNRPDLSRERKEVAAYLMERRYTSLADVMFVRRLSVSRLLDPATTSIVFARDHNLRSFHEDNHILVGSRRAVPWVDLFSDSLDFHFVYDERTRTIVVENRKPQGGESSRYELHKQGVAGGESFSLIACVPNLGKNGYVLILSGQEVSGTEAAGNIFTTEQLLKPLLDRLPPLREGQVPHFEALLRTRHLEYTSEGFDVLAMHVH
jgi:hypothetical protein